MSNPLDKQFEQKAEGITWLSPQSLIQLRQQANPSLLNNSIIHAKQGGAYLSSFKGRGMEFDESRIYQAGDDIRNMDWRVTARTGSAHTKVFREERERPVLLWLDLNPSMMFATRNKFKAVVASEIASLIAWSAAKNNDRLGGLIFSSDEHVELKPRRGKTSVLDFIGRCTKHKTWADGHTGTRSERSMMSAISRLRKVTHPGSLIFMISDFHNVDEQSYSHIANIARHNDIVMIKITDPIEAELPVSGDYKLTDGINQLQLHTANKKARKQYHQRFIDSNDRLTKFCRQHRVHLIQISTAENHIDKLNEGLGVRVHKKAQYRSA